MTQRPELPLNDWQSYHQRVAELLECEMTVLDLGCGRGDVAPFPWRRFEEVRLIGADVDPSAARNPAIDDFVELPAEGQWPLPAAGVDLVLARYVLEHVARPAEFLANVRRALKPGGEFLFLTPNALHPAMALSRILPIALKRAVLARSGHAQPEDVFSTHYRMNTPQALARLAAANGFELVRHETREYAPCGYLSFCAAGRVLAQAYRGTVVTTGLESQLGAQIIGRWRKPAALGAP